MSINNVVLYYCKYNCLLVNYTIIKYDDETGKLKKVQEPLKVEPIGFTIILFLSLILIVQTIGMVRHRWQTFQHVLASTVLACFRRRSSKDREGEELVEENAVEIGTVYCYSSSSLSPSSFIQYTPVLQLNDCKSWAMMN